MAAVAFNHLLVQLDDVATHRLADADALAAVVVAAAGAVGLPAQAPPVTQSGPRGVSVGLLCRDGHIVVHTTLPEAVCLVDIVARLPADVNKGLDVIRRRLAAH